MNNELVLSTKDLTDVGISSQLTSNDLVEVVAHDIYDKYMEMVNDLIKRGNSLRKEYDGLMDGEAAKMRKAVRKYLPSGKVVSVPDEEDDDYEEITGTTSSFKTSNDYWPTISLFGINIKEKDRGSFVEEANRNINMPNLKSKETKVKLTITTGRIYKTEKINVVGGITGEIEENVSKTFTQVITVPISRFKQYAERVYSYNKEVTAILEFLPKNGALSVERFTREARVKMNKKIISAQSPDFRKKISQLFNIKL